MRPDTRVRRFRETRYPHKRSEGLTVRRTNGATRELIREAKPMSVPSKELREAGEGAIRYALADWGKWAPEQIDNALATLGRAWAAEHADEIRRETLHEGADALQAELREMNDGPWPVDDREWVERACEFPNLLRKLAEGPEGSDAP